MHQEGGGGVNSSSNLPVRDGLEAIAAIVRSWCDFDRMIREREGKPVAADSAIMSPPEWPTHGVLANWIATLEEARDKIDGLEYDLRSALSVIRRRADRRDVEWLRLNYPTYEAEWERSARGLLEQAIEQCEALNAGIAVRSAGLVIFLPLCHDDKDY